MPVENDWVLLSNYNDRSLIRNTLAYKLFGEMGNYSVKTSLCEVLIDSAYRGIYVFGEKIKRDNNRVNIAKLTTSDNAGDDVNRRLYFRTKLLGCQQQFFI
jgi:spore coat protein CotH